MLNASTQLKVDMGLMLLLASMKLTPSDPEVLRLLDWEIENANLYVTDHKKWRTHSQATPPEQRARVLEFDTGITALMTRLNLDITEGVEAMKVFRRWFVDEHFAGKSLHSVAAEA